MTRRFVIDGQEGDYGVYYRGTDDCVSHHATLAEAEAAMYDYEADDRLFDEDVSTADERYSGGPGTLIDETYDDPAEQDPYDEYVEDVYGESMDGDFDSAMASAGMGTDEDYGYYGGDE